MKKFTINALCTLTLLLCLPLCLAADERTEPIDVIIALDKSLSMVEEIDAVRDYVNTHLVDELLIPGDFFLTVAFYGQTEIPVAVKIGGAEDKARIKEIVGGLKADGVYTDIGNALDVLGQELETKSDPERKKYLLLLTDGIQEAPPESKYYSPVKGEINHAFLENTRIIQKKGWKIHVLGVGADAEALEISRELTKELAEELGGEYSELSERPTAEEILEKTGEFLGSIVIKDGVSLSRIRSKGRGTLSFTLESKGYAETKQIDLASVILNLPGTAWGQGNILPSPASITVEPDSVEAVSMPVLISGELAPGEYNGTLKFVFAGENRFLPVAADIAVRVQTWAQNYRFWLLGAALLLVLLLLLLALWLSRLSGRSRLRIRLLVEGKPIAPAGSAGQEPAYRTLREGKFLFLNDAEESFILADKRTPGSLARLSVSGDRLRFGMLKAERFPKLNPREIPEDAREHTFTVRTQSGARKAVGFESPAVRH
jgi:Mg-chelatase subunit ChlD